MSFLQTLETSLFTDNVLWVTINVGNVTHTVPMDTILNCPRRVRIAAMILHYFALKDGNPEKASGIFRNRNGQLFSHILHYADTRHLVYPSDLELTKSLVRDLCRYGLIRIRDGCCHLCLMEYFKLNGMDDFRNDELGKRDSSSGYPFLHISPETVIIQTENSGGDIFTLRAWGTPNTLQEVFPKETLENDSTYCELKMRVTVIHTDMRQFMNQIADTVCCVVKKLNFRPTVYSTWCDEMGVVYYGQWLFYRDRPAIVSVASVMSIPPLLSDAPPSPVTSPEMPSENLINYPQPKKKRRCCPCFSKKNDSVDITTDYPELPPKTSSVEVTKITAKNSATEVTQTTPRTTSAEVLDIPRRTSATVF